MISIMKSPYSLAALALATISVASYAEAAALNTAPVWADSPASFHACNVANISTADLKSVKVELLKNNGAVLLTNTYSPLVAGASVETSPFGGYSGFARCRFTVSGSASKIRANISVFHYTGSYYDTLAIDSAR